MTADPCLLCALILVMLHNVCSAIACMVDLTVQSQTVPFPKWIFYSNDELIARSLPWRLFSGRVVVCLGQYIYAVCARPTTVFSLWIHCFTENICNTAFARQEEDDCCSTFQVKPFMNTITEITSLTLLFCDLFDLYIFYNKSSQNCSK